MVVVEVIVGRGAPIVAGGAPRVGSHRPRVRGGEADDGREREILAVVSGEMVVMLSDVGGWYGGSWQS
ncbi:MAG: hypothetical protein V9E87_01015 [Gemmatimonadales bacterium]